MGSFPLHGLDRSSWDPSHENDLVAINSRRAPDRFTRWFTDSFIPTYHALIGQKLKVRLSSSSNLSDPEDQQRTAPLNPGIYKYEESTMRLIVHCLTTVIASLLPLCSVVVLYVIDHNGLRIGMIVVLSACFSMALVLMTNARQIEIFAATSA